MCCLVEDEKLIPEKWESLFSRPKRFQTRAEEYVSDKLPGIVHGKLIRNKTGYLVVEGKRLVLVGAPEITDDIASEFQTLANQWKQDTLAISSVSDIVMHHAYQRIMAMGKPALRFILQDLRDHYGDWFHALHYIAGVDIAAGTETVEDAKAAWLDWGHREGYI